MFYKIYTYLLKLILINIQLKLRKIYIVYIFLLIYLRKIMKLNKILCQELLRQYFCDQHLSSKYIERNNPSFEFIEWLFINNKNIIFIQ